MWVVVVVTIKKKNHHHSIDDEQKGLPLIIVEIILILSASCLRCCVCVVFALRCVVGVLYVFEMQLHCTTVLYCTVLLLLGSGWVLESNNHCPSWSSISLYILQHYYIFKLLVVNSKIRRTVVLVVRLGVNAISNGRRKWRHRCQPWYRSWWRRVKQKNWGAIE